MPRTFMQKYREWERGEYSTGWAEKKHGYSMGRHFARFDKQRVWPAQRSVHIRINLRNHAASSLDDWHKRSPELNHYWRQCMPTSERRIKRLIP